MICKKDIFELCIADKHRMPKYHQLNFRSPVPKKYGDISDPVRIVVDIYHRTKKFFYIIRKMILSNWNYDNADNGLVRNSVGLEF